MPLDHQSPCILVKKDQKKVHYCSSEKKSQVTAVVCVNATGSAMPPYIIFDAKNLNLDWAGGEIPGITYGLSSNGWINMELFKSVVDGGSINTSLSMQLLHNPYFFKWMVIQSRNNLIC